MICCCQSLRGRVCVCVCQHKRVCTWCFVLGPINTEHSFLSARRLRQNNNRMLSKEKPFSLFSPQKLSPLLPASLLSWTRGKQQVWVLGGLPGRCIAFSFGEPQRTAVRWGGGVQHLSTALRLHLSPWPFELKTSPFWLKQHRGAVKNAQVSSVSAEKLSPSETKPSYSSSSNCGICVGFFFFLAKKKKKKKKKPKISHNWPRSTWKMNKEKGKEGKEKKNKTRDSEARFQQGSRDRSTAVPAGQHGLTQPLTLW